tara:strand:+ start:571 stop:1287 length:717 start_codon:yes stop_codon:yes gene_type:complete
MQEKLHMRRHPGTNPEAFQSIVTGINENSIFLEETYCYPKGGGQPGDTGIFTSADGVKTEFFEVLSGSMIIHPVEDTGDYVEGDEITCQIDVEKRNAHAKMHTSQHIFSAIAEDIWGAETVGNQIGTTQSRVDLFFEDKSIFDPDSLIDEVNSILSSSRPVNVHEWERERILSHDQMRHTKFMDRIPSPVLRVVEVEGVDLCPCAGTHVSNTAEIPLVSYVGKKNKGKGRLRITYQFE